MSEKERLTHCLDEIESHQKELSRCHDYYQLLEREFEEKKQNLASPDDYEELEKNLAVLNQEYEHKVDLLYEELNATLITGYDLAKKIGHEIGHDFKKIWDYMTNSIRAEVKLEHVLHDIAALKKELKPLELQNTLTDK